MRKCKSCKRSLVDGAFLKVVRRGWRVRICNECAHSNMVRWERSNMVGKKVSAYSKLR